MRPRRGEEMIIVGGDLGKGKLIASCRNYSTFRENCSVWRKMTFGWIEFFKTMCNG